jgi:hypothetical protein
MQSLRDTMESLFWYDTMQSSIWFVLGASLCSRFSLPFPLFYYWTLRCSRNFTMFPISDSLPMSSPIRPILYRHLTSIASFIAN